MGGIPIHENSGDQHDFSKLLLAFQDAVRFGCLRKRQHVADDRVEPALPGEGENPLLLPAGGSSSAQNIQVPPIEGIVESMRSGSWKGLPGRGNPVRELAQNFALCR